MGADVHLQSFVQAPPLAEGASLIKGRKLDENGKIRIMKVPFDKGGFRGIFRRLQEIPAAPLYKRGEFLPWHGPMKFHRR